MKKPRISIQQYLRFALAMTIVLSSLFLFVRHFTLKRIDEVSEINRDYSLTKGIITKLYYATGRRVSVKFKVNNKIIEGSDYIIKSSSEKVGDSIAVKYSNKNPENFITKLNPQY